MKQLLPIAALSLNVGPSICSGMLALVLGLGGLIPIEAQAQNLRDPTLPWMEANVPAAPSGTDAHLAGSGLGPFGVLVRNGVPKLVVGTHLYEKGQKLGNATIERISEAEVWLKDGNELRKYRQFKAIERYPAAMADAPVVQTACPGDKSKVAAASAGPASGSGSPAHPRHASCAHHPQRGLHR
jgi:hypothetical protein